MSTEEKIEFTKVEAPAGLSPGQALTLAMTVKGSFPEILTKVVAHVVTKDEKRAVVERTRANGGNLTEADQARFKELQEVATIAFVAGADKGIESATLGGATGAFCFQKNGGVLCDDPCQECLRKGLAVQTAMRRETTDEDDEVSTALRERRGATTQ